jgi:2-hydroxycyclohexanecarboxyl-CoA dehydrogenase
MGAEIVDSLAELGARVAVLDINGEGAREVAKRVDGLAVEADLTRPNEVARAYQSVYEALGPVDVLVSNAGWDKVGRFVDSDPAIWDVLLAVNLRAPIQLTQCVLPSMIERSAGRLIYVSSDAGRVGSSGEAVYSACKGGIISFAKSIARELARKGITANTICPGPTDTALTAEAAAENPKLIAALERAIPFGRLGLPSDIAPAVAFLATQEAGFITGQTLSISGGLTMA